MTMCLGIAAVTSVVSLVDAAILKSYGPIETDRWVYLWEDKLSSQSLNQISASIPNYRDWKAGTGNVFSEMVIWLPWSYTASGTSVGGPQHVTAAVISADAFTAIKTAPTLGRFPTAEDSASNERRVMLSYGFWRSALGEDPAIAGKTIQLNGMANTVVGVAPSGFQFPPEDQVDVWTALPSTVLASPQRAQRGYRVAARLRDGITLRQAQSALDLVARRLSNQYPEDRDYGITAIPMREAVAGDIRSPLLAVAGAVAFALVLLCLNVGYLQLVHLESRRKEIALRAALGATRRALLRQSLIQSVLLFGTGGAAGLALSPLMTQLLMQSIPPEAIPWLRPRISLAPISAAIGITMAAALLTGAFPFFRAFRKNLLLDLNAGGYFARGSGQSIRLSRVFLAAQIALVFIPLCAALLLAQSVFKLERVPTGFQTANRLSLALYAPRTRYATAATVAGLAEKLRENTKTIPGVKDVGLSQAIPFANGQLWIQAISRSDPSRLKSVATLPMARYAVATSGLLEAMGVPLKNGRLISESDTATTQRIVVINQTLAERYFPGEDPIGKTMWIGHAEALAGSSPRVVVGVVGDMHIYALDTAPDAAAWVPMAQQSDGEEVWRNMYLLCDADENPTTDLTAIRKRIAEVDSDLAVFDVELMSDRVVDSIWRQRLSSDILAAFSLATLAVAMLGIYGVTSYAVAMRSREIGIRIALGAERTNIRTMILRQNMAMACLGVAAGFGGTVLLTRFISSLLFGIRPVDPASMTLVTLIMAVTAAAASWFPARRATRVDPISVLRQT
jgi:putative ABC transport system permease protein